MTLKANTPLAKHFIKKTKKISIDDLCYFSDETGEIINIHPIKKNDWGGIEYNTDFDYEIKKISNEDDGHFGYSKDNDNYPIEDFVQYQPIDKSMVETLYEREQREQKEAEQKQEHIREAKLEADKQIIEQKRQILEQKLQQNLANKNNQDNRKSNQIDDNFINEIKNNIWL